MPGACPTCESIGEIERPYIPVEKHPLFADRSVAGCLSCGLRYCDPMPGEAELAAYYTGGDYDHGTRVEAGIEGPWALASLRAKAQCRFVESVLGHEARSWLDIGAGYGVLLDEAGRRGAHTGGVEPTPVRHADLEQRGHRAWEDVDAVEGSWEVVSFSHVLEHVADPRSFLRRAARLLVPGGVLFCEVPNVSLARPDPDEPHVLFFTSQSLASTFQSAGLEIRRVGEAGRRTGKGWDRLSQYAASAKQSGRLPAPLSRFDAVQRYGQDQGRIYLRCAGSVR